VGGHEVLQALEQHLLVDRFEQVAARSGVFCPGDEFLVGDRRHHDDGGFFVSLTDATSELDAVADGHDDIADHDVEIVSEEGVERLLAIFGFGDPKTSRFDDIADALSYQCRIID
jgi:hypothetical protein